MCVCVFIIAVWWQSLFHSGDEFGDYSAKLFRIFLVWHMATSRHRREFDRLGSLGHAAPFINKLDGVAMRYNAIAVPMDDEDWTARERAQLMVLALTGPY